MPSLTAPVTVVVTPLECQSKPSTQPNAWNQNGSESRRSISSGPNSDTMCTLISRASFTIREKSHAGAFPPCSGSCAVPVRARMLNCTKGSDVQLLGFLRSIHDEAEPRRRDPSPSAR